MGVQEVVADVSTRSTVEELFIEFPDGGVLVGLADGVGHILSVDCFGAGRTNLSAGGDGLSAAADATTGASHEFNEVAFGEFAAGADVLQNALGIGGAVANSDLHGGAIEPIPIVEEALEHSGDLGHGRDFDFGVLDAFKATHGQDVGFAEDLLDLDAGDQFDDGAEGRFHHTAGGAEDDAGAGSGSERIVEVGFLKGRQIDAGFLDHLGHFTAGEAEIDVLVTAVDHLRPVALELFGRAGHEGDGDDVLGVDVVLLGPVGLDQRTEHLLGGLGRGHVSEHFGIEVLDVLDPTRRARGELGKTDGGVLLDQGLLEADEQVRCLPRE